MKVKRLSQMFEPGTIGATADCDTCGDKGKNPVVTRVSMKNMEKLNNPIKTILNAGVTADEAVEVGERLADIIKAGPAQRGRKKKDAPLEDQSEPTEVEEND